MVSRHFRIKTLVSECPRVSVHCKGNTWALGHPVKTLHSSYFLYIATIRFAVRACIDTLILPASYVRRVVPTSSSFSVLPHHFSRIPTRDFSSLGLQTTRGSRF